VFAPGWGFCEADDPVWRATIAFAWSRENDGYFAGPLGGLGSLHTRHPWPLGDLQEIVVARVVGDAERERRGWERLERVETWDGLLPEAYDETTGAVASRHWFAWPAALRALLALDPMLKAP
jgi:meiotically up-regulated gene 157 (Mug157) protein